MKLLSLHINNYGKFSNYDYEFKDFSSFCEENGFGKSTIASFIKAMFYGLDSVTSRSTKFLDRKHFYPFKGGRFGGNIVFEYKNHKYRIERDFDEKSDTRDSLVVYKDNNQTKELGDVPGITLFGINKESFERLLLINSDKISIETDSDINKKLNNYVENVGEDFNIDQVIKKITEERKGYNTKTKDATANIKILKDEIKNLELTKESLDSMYADLSKAEEEMNKAKAKLDNANNLSTVLAKWKYVDDNQKEINDKKNKLSEIDSKYPNGLPEAVEVSTIKNAFSEINKIEGKLSGSSISNDDRNEYARLESKYDGFVPSNEDINKIEKQIDEYEKLKKEIDDNSSYEKSNKEKELENHFLGQDYSDYNIELIEQEVKRLKTAEASLDGIKPSTLVSKKVTEPKKQNNKLLIGLIITSVVLLGAGAGCFAVAVGLGVALLVLGFIVLALDMFIYFNSKISKITEDITVEESNPEYEKRKHNYDELKNKVNIMFSKYRYEGSNVDILLYKLQNDVKEYNDIIDKNKKREELLKTDKERIEQLSSSLDEFFSSISMQDISYRKAIEIVKADLVRLSTLTKIVKNNDDNKSKTTEKLDKYKNIINEFYSTYSLSKDYSMDSINLDIINHDKLKEEINYKEHKLEIYKRDNKLTKKPTNLNVDISELDENYNTFLSEYTELRNEIDKLEEQISVLDDKRNELEEFKSNQEIYDDKIRLFDALKEEINKADQVLKDKYVAPIKNRFTYYANLLEHTIGENVYMDKDYKISFDREGALRSFEHLSSGTLSICALCFRLAIVDNMFDTEKPFIIMDDPFVFLDENHFNKTKELVNELSKDKQIIYFSCHKSRII
ncbi:MAG: AAA family ATPase [Acholeplasmatales bacterium]|nr:AAA family ATPase [Acholeplasmatales bacterium]